MKSCDYLICDTETTGLIEPEACEIAWIEVTPDLKVVSDFSTLIKPSKPICCSASGVHGIMNEDVAGAPLIDEVDFPSGNVCMIGHNVKFDAQIMSPYMNVVFTCDSLVLARRMLEGAPDYKLSTLGCYCGLPRQSAHRALNDCYSVLGLLNYLIEGSGYTLLELIDFSNRPVKIDTMPWGKYKGCRLVELPASYKNWLLGLPDLDADLKFSLSH